MNDGLLQPEKVRIETSSLASQAVGPSLNDVEMSYAEDIGIAKLDDFGLQTFEERLQGIGIDGSRTHTLTETCTIP